MTEEEIVALRMAVSNSLVTLVAETVRTGMRSVSGYGGDEKVAARDAGNAAGETVLAIDALIEARLKERMS